MKTGIELEYWTINKNGELVSCKEIAKKFDFAEQEFVEPLLEIKTSPHSNFRELKNEIISNLKEAQKALEEEDLLIAPIGTPLNSKEIEKVPSKRGKIQEEIIGKNLDAAKRVAGTHIHFEQENVKEQLNKLIALDPALALVNSSPYYQGENLASSSRNQAYRYHCYKDFPKHGHLWEYTDSKEEWVNRINQRFEEFIEAGKENGISEEEIRKNFSAEDALWTPVRLRPDFGTVEWRSPDSCSLGETLNLIEQMRKIMEQDSFESRPEFEKVQKLSSKAIKEGLQSDDVENYLNDLGFDTDNCKDVSSEIKKGDTITLKKARKERFNAGERFREEVYSF